MLFNTRYLDDMDREKQFKDFLRNGNTTHLAHISVDCVIFGFHDDQLKVLLLKWREGGLWCLPGGFVERTEAVDASAVRILKDRTGLDAIFLQQFHTFGDPDRERKKEQMKMPYGAVRGSWLQDRFISIGYYALVEYSRVDPKPDWLSDECRWWDIHSLPRMVLDHSKIIAKALDALRASLYHHPVGYNLLPEKFTMPELQRLYETILDKPLDRRNFQKKMLSLDVLERLKERKTGGAHKAPYYYRFDKKKYIQAMKQGLRIGF